jgi:hypothetical protein
VLIFDTKQTDIHELCKYRDCYENVDFISKAGFDRGKFPTYQTFYTMPNVDAQFSEPTGSAKCDGRLVNQMSWFLLMLTTNFV